MSMIEVINTERNRILIEMDVKAAWQWMPGASCEEVVICAIHKSRYEITSMPDALRHESGRWLREHGYGRRGGMPILPEGELPK